MKYLRIFLLVVLFLYGVPFWKLRYQFRSLVYRKQGFIVHIMPRFAKETAALFSNRYFNDEKEKNIALRYRWYTAGYIILLLLFFFL